MKRTIMMIAVLAAMALANDTLQMGDNVLWYKAITNGYGLQADPGPACPAGANVIESKIFSCSNNNSGYDDVSFRLGCGNSHGGYIWSSAVSATALNDPANRGTIISNALFRAEARDVVSGTTGPFCNSGNIHLKIGVVDVSLLVSAYGSMDALPDNAIWPDVYLGEGLTYGALSSVIITGTLTDTNIAGVQGRTSNDDPSVLDSVFLGVNVTKQAQWMLDNAAAGSFNVIAMLTDTNDQDTGGIAGRAFEACDTGAQNGGPGVGACTPWSKDDNTAHFLITVTQVSVEKDESVSAGNAALNIAPNPFNPTTTISYATGAAKHAVLRIISIDGKQIFSKIVGGNGSLAWKAGMAASGVYLCRIDMGNKTVTRKMTLLR